MARRGQTLWVASGFPDVDRKCIRLETDQDHMRTAEVALGYGNQWSFSVWGRNVYHSGNTGRHAIVSVAPSAGAANRIYIGKSGALATDTTLAVELTTSGGAGTKNLSVASVWTLNTWRHVVVTFDGTLTAANEVTTYIDGVDTAYSGGPGGETAMSDTARILAIGDHLVPSSDWNAMRQFRYWGVAIWNAAIDADAVTWLYNGRNPLGLNLNTNSGDYDYSANLKFWFQHGYEPTPNLGKNYLSGGGTDLTAFNLVDDTDILADYPTPA